MHRCIYLFVCNLIDTEVYSEMHINALVNMH